jgi:hypothetical protein
MQHGDALQARPADGLCQKSKGNHLSNNRLCSSPPQTCWVCKTLAAGRTLPRNSEICGVTGWRLAVVIHKLRTKQAWPVDDRLRCKDNIKHSWQRRGTAPTNCVASPAPRPFWMENRTSSQVVSQSGRLVGLLRALCGGFLKAFFSLAQRVAANLLQPPLSCASSAQDRGKTMNMFV